MKEQKSIQNEENLRYKTSIGKKELKKYEPLLVRKVVESLIKCGKININGMTNKEIAIEVLKLVEDTEFNFILDYKDSLLEQARLYRSKGKNELSCLLYATWFEHWINEVISILCHRKGLSESEVSEIIRKTSFRGKYTWLLKLFDFKEINKSHLNLIFRLMDLRNNFVHYKWKERSNDFEKEEIFVIEKIEKTIKYIRNIENTYIYNNSKRMLSNL